MPPHFGISSENAAHRIAVEWVGEDGVNREGVFVPRRDTDSRLNALAGGRVFPGVHRLSRFHVKDKGGSVRMKVESEKEGAPLVELDVRETDEFPNDSIFASLSDSSDFFESGCIGYSSRPNSCVLDGLLLRIQDWRVSPLDVALVRSSYFDDRAVFPEGKIKFDHALLMRDIPHEWHSEPEMEDAVIC